jgi:hypothetical protein
VNAVAIDVDSILDRKSAVDRAFKQGRVKPWRLYTREEATANSETDTANKQLTNGEQTANKTNSIALKSAEEFLQILFRLSNQQRKLFLYIHERCLENGDLASGPISSHIFSSIIASNNNTVRTQLQRLIEKNLMHRLPGKPGRGGFHAYSMTHLVIKAGNDFRRHILKESAENQKRSFNETANNQLTNSKQTANTIANNDPLSSSSNLIKTTTTSDSEIIEISEVEIDISPLEDIGFTRSHLTQIQKRTDLTTEIIQASINHFAFDLNQNGKAEQLKGSPLNFFMGILIKQGIPYNPPENFEDEKCRALRSFLEKQKKLQENFAKLEDEAREQAFEQWYAKLNEEQKLLLLPPILRGRNNSEMSKRLSLNGHFSEHEWPKMRSDILKENC